MRQPLISIIVPIYNVEPFLEECINSLISQSYSNLEIILIDDGSTDNCPCICDRYREKDSRIIVVHKENGGLVSARKAGIIVANGEYVSFVDGDDFVANNHYQQIVNAILLYGADIITTDLSLYFDGIVNSNLQPLRYEYLDKEGIQDFILPNMISGDKYFTFNIFPSVCTKCIKKEIVIKYLMMVPDSIVMGEDAALSYPCIKNANSICHIEETGYMYRMRNSSISRSYDSLLLDRIQCLIDYLCEQFDYKSNQMIDYISYLTTLVIVNSFKGEKKVKASFLRIKGFMSDKKIKFALENSRAPQKMKFLFSSIYAEHFWIVWIIKTIYLIKS